MTYDKRAKIIATIGPASASPTVIEDLIKEGLDVARLNLSHGTHQERRNQIRNIKEAAKKLRKPVSIMADLQGLKLRLGVLKRAKEFKKGDVLFFGENPSVKTIPLQFNLASYVSEGERMFINDGLVEFKIIKVSDNIVTAQAQNSGVISSNKGVNIPDAQIKDTVVTKKDIKDLKFALNEGVDLVALSFIQTAQDLEVVKEMVKKSKIKIVAKIERKAAVGNLEEIMQISDAVMIARGDLGIETKISLVPLIQKKIITLAKRLEKPVIVATQMLESMIYYPRPTRAEASDVANAVWEGADAVMLSAETAVGKYPVEAVRLMNEIVLLAEKYQKDKSFII